MEQRKKIRNMIKVIDLLDFDNKSISKVQSALNKILYDLEIDYPNAKDDLTCSISGSDPVVVIIHNRLETDIEYNNRLLREEEQKTQLETNERKELARLKEKYKND